MKNMNAQLQISLKKTVLALALTGTYSAAMAAEPNPQQQIDAANYQILQQQRDEALQKQIQPSVNVNLGQNAPALTANQRQFLQSNSETPCFAIQSILLEGDGAQQFQYTLKDVTHGQNNVIGRCLGVQGLNQVLNLVQNRIIADGYVTTRVLLPAQNIASGQLRMVVIPGRIDQVKFAQGTSARAHKINALPIKSGDVLNIRDLEQGLENFKRVPTVEADFKIQPAENNDTPGYSDVMLAWQQSKPYRINLSLDDSGAKSTGRYLGTATVSLDHLLTLNDLFYVSYNHDLGEVLENMAAMGCI